MSPEFNRDGVPCMCGLAEELQKMKNNPPFTLDESGSIPYLTIDAGLPVWAAFSTRRGGVSHPPYAAANLAYHVGDDPLKVAENRRLLSGAVTGDETIPLYTVSQVHGHRCLQVKSSQPPAEVERYPADALLTADPGILLGVMTADCLPVLLVDRQLRAVAAVHAGWRGILARIVPRTIKSMEENYGIQPGELLAILGPCIGRCCYPVGKELIGTFAAERPFTHTTRWYEKLSGTYYLDLECLQVLQLGELGVLPEFIKVANVCTACENFFFSYRREHGITGRQIAVVGLQP